ncbi:hypothetical protein NDU88_003144 [Pleurodeles waltl]|uniref:Uncharacterized protein n=1 Tax=Pleurodeles waltl TaxID=8319 RepID=A0AAV7UXM5_PLEWA|nr:hypothetical protein NDU88_003144 [Pleurodeles waltl]
MRGTVATATAPPPPRKWDKASSCLVRVHVRQRSQSNNHSARSTRAASGVKKEKTRRPYHRGYGRLSVLGVPKAAPELPAAPRRPHAAPGVRLEA